MSIFKKILITVILCAACVIPAACYSDGADIAGYAADAVENMRLYGIMQGDGEGAFNPRSYLTRQEMFKIIYKLREGGQNEPSALLAEAFSLTEAVPDRAKTGRWARGYAAYVLKNEIFVGDGEGNLDPLGRLTVSQCAAVLLRTIKLTSSAMQELYPLTGPEWDYNAAYLANSLGLFNALPEEDRLSPEFYSRYVTRQEIACMCDAAVNAAGASIYSSVGPLSDRNFHIRTGIVVGTDGEALNVWLGGKSYATYPSQDLSLVGHAVRWSDNTSGGQRVICKIERISEAAASMTPDEFAEAGLGADEAVFFLSNTVSGEIKSAADIASAAAAYAGESWQSLEVRVSAAGTAVSFSPKIFVLLGSDASLPAGLEPDAALKEKSAGDYVLITPDYGTGIAALNGCASIVGVSGGELRSDENTNFFILGSAVEYRPELVRVRPDGTSAPTDQGVVNRYAEFTAFEGQAKAFAAVWNGIMLDVFSSGQDDYDVLMTDVSVSIVRADSTQTYIYAGLVGGAPAKVVSEQPFEGDGSLGIAEISAHGGVLNGRLAQEGLNCVRGIVTAVTEKNLTVLVDGRASDYRLEANPTIIGSAAVGDEVFIAYDSVRLVTTVKYVLRWVMNAKTAF